MNPHMIGFEREELFHKALAECCKANDKFKAKTLVAVLNIICPGFMDGLFEIRPCIRKLRFIGYDNWGDDAPPYDFDQFYKYGEVYESVDFDGGTYRINGIDRRIGLAYFEVC